MVRMAKEGARLARCVSVVPTRRDGSLCSRSRTDARSTRATREKASDYRYVGFISGSSVQSAAELNSLEEAPLDLDLYKAVEIKQGTLATCPTLLFRELQRDENFAFRACADVVVRPKEVDRRHGCAKLRGCWTFPSAVSLKS